MAGNLVVGAARSTADILGDGCEQPVARLGRKHPQVGDRATNCSVTFSSPKSPTYWRSPDAFTRPELARFIGNCWDEAARMCFSASEVAPTPACAIFREAHQDGRAHFHIIITCQRTRIWSYLYTVCRKKRVACDFEIGVGAGVDHVLAMLRYCMVHTTSKWALDGSPYFSTNFKMNPKVQAEAAASRGKLARKPADEEEVKNYLFRHPNITTWVEFSTAVDFQLKKEPSCIPLLRLSQFLSKSGGKHGKATVAAIFARRDELVHYEDNLRTYADYIRISSLSSCTCPKPSELATSLKSLIDWHDENEISFKDSRGLIGSFAYSLYADEFPDRRQTIYFTGTFGSGKSSVLNIFLNVVPARRIFRHT